jgi:hypothetical protein
MNASQTSNAKSLKKTLSNLLRRGAEGFLKEINKADINVLFEVKRVDVTLRKKGKNPVSVKLTLRR